MQVTLHAKIEVAAITMLLLGSCSSEPRHTVAEAYDLADVARANSVNALYSAQELEERVSAIEERLAM